MASSGKVLELTMRIIAVVGRIRGPKDAHALTPEPSDMIL
jgi:hypothetical protein